MSPPDTQNRFHYFDCGAGIVNVHYQGVWSDFYGNTKLYFAGVRGAVYLKLTLAVNRTACNKTHFCPIFPAGNTLLPIRRWISL
jgi:hypothetical protein